MEIRSQFKQELKKAFVDFINPLDKIKLPSLLSATNKHYIEIKSKSREKSKLF